MEESSNRKGSSGDNTCMNKSNYIRGNGDGDDRSDKTFMSVLN